MMLGRNPYQSILSWEERRLIKTPDEGWCIGDDRGWDGRMPARFWIDWVWVQNLKARWTDGSFYCDSWGPVAAHDLWLNLNWIRDTVRQSTEQWLSRAAGLPDCPSSSVTQAGKARVRWGIRALYIYFMKLVVLGLFLTKYFWILTSRSPKSCWLQD